MATTSNPSKRVLFLTNSEHGQAQIQLSVAYELLSHPNLEAHIASFEELRPRIAALNKLSSSQKVGKPAGVSLDQHIYFQLIDYPSMVKALGSMNPLMPTSDVCHPPGFWGALGSYSKIAMFSLGWEPEEYVAIVRRCEELIADIRPDVVVVDASFNPGTDACRRVYGDVQGKKPYALLNPMHFWWLADLQPSKAVWWKFPGLSTGFPFPLPLHLIPLNIFLRLALILHFIFSLRALRFARHRARSGYPGPFPGFDLYWPSETYLSPCLRELDYRGIQVPENVVGCGPITIPHGGVEDADAELARWLRAGGSPPRTVLINLGSHSQSEGDDAVAIATGLRLLLAQRPDLQVLWKLRTAATHARQFDAIIGPQLQSGQVRIVDWLDVDPAAILATGHVCCMVHHGGANSFFETTAAGVPQVVLPVWFDTYDLARHVEYLGVGVWGNKQVAPHVGAEEAAQALLRVIGAEGMRKRAKELREVCERAGGRKKAADVVVEMVVRAKGVE